MRTVFALLLLPALAVAAPVPKGVKKPPNPDGQWRLVGFSGDGAEPTPPTSMVLDWYIEGQHLLCGVKGEPAYHAKGEPNFTTPDPARPQYRRWGPHPAALEMDGDTLRVCYAHDGRKELTECKPAKGIHYYVFQRAKE